MTAHLGLLDGLAKQVGVDSWFPYQVDCFTYVAEDPAPGKLRICLYYRTGAGKSITALVCLAILGYREATVIAPPSTHAQWIAVGKKLGIDVTPMSHAKFRMNDTKLARDRAVIADEFHMFGGHSGKGWKKLDRLSKGLQAPMILASATPNYNDAERVYCIQHILDPASVAGGFLNFLYQHCTTEPNPFGMMPNVTGFQKFKSAEEYLAYLPKVMYLPDELQFTIEDTFLPKKISPEMRDFGYVEPKHRIIASAIERYHEEITQTLITKHLIDDEVVDWVMGIVDSLHGGQVMIYCDHASVAKVLKDTPRMRGRRQVITGDDNTTIKEIKLNSFLNGDAQILIGTAAIATGTDGIDKVCDTLIILDDTQDDAMRRQLIGRIMPRGKDADTSKKRIHRLVLT